MRGFVQRDAPVQAQLPLAIDLRVHDPDPDVVFEIKVEGWLRLEFCPR